MIDRRVHLNPPKLDLVGVTRVFMALLGPIPGEARYCGLDTAVALVEAVASATVSGMEAVRVRVASRARVVARLAEDPGQEGSQMGHTAAGN